MSRGLADELGMVFGEKFDALTDGERHLLALDLQYLLDTEGEDSPTCGAVELRRRIGGPDNLRSYVDCLVAGARKGQTAPSKGNYR